jgi:ribosomal protein S18 acetylase RimI-like enzyme
MGWSALFGAHTDRGCAQSYYRCVELDDCAEEVNIITNPCSKLECMELTIRRATAADGPGIHALTASVHPPRVPEELNGNSGFLMSLHSAETYSARAALSDLCFVAGIGNELAGFLTAYPASLCAAWYAPDSGYSYAFVQAGPDCVLLDQIAVSPAHRKVGVATRLYEAFAAACGARPVVLDIAHAPVANLSSLRFFRDQRGYQLLREFPSGDLSYGVYMAPRP